MVQLAVWYDQEPDNDFGEGDPAIVVGSPAELDALVDRVLDETSGNDVSAMMQVGIRGHTGYPVLEVGLGRTKGFITYHASDSGSTQGDGDVHEVVEYVYMGNLSDVDASSEVPLAVVRQGLHEFLATGERPSVIRPTH